MRTSEAAIERSTTFSIKIGSEARKFQEGEEPEYVGRDEAHNPVAYPEHIRTGSGAMKSFGSTSMECGVFLRTSFGNLGKGEWFVLGIYQIAGTPTHKCPKCVNRLALMCKQIHTWFYTTVELRGKTLCSAARPA